MLTKTQARIMEVFVGSIRESFSIKQIAEHIKKPYPLVHRSITSLINERFLVKDKHHLISLNYKENHLELAYIESLRKKVFLQKHATVKLLIHDLLEKIGTDFFVLLIFGSYVVQQRKPNDLDILVIIENESEINIIERSIQNLVSHFSLKVDCSVITPKSVYEMLSKRNELNVMNETLDNHILLFGAENYYRFIKNAR